MQRVQLTLSGGNDACEMPFQHAQRVLMALREAEAWRIQSAKYHTLWVLTRSNVTVSAHKGNNRFGGVRAQMTRGYTSQVQKLLCFFTHVATTGQSASQDSTFDVWTENRTPPWHLILSRRWFWNLNNLFEWLQVESRQVNAYDHSSHSLLAFLQCILIKRHFISQW